CALRSRCASSLGVAHELLQRLAREQPRLSGLEIAELQGAEPDPLECGDLVADPLEHAPHLTVATLADRQLDPAGADPAHLRRRGRPVGEGDAGPEPLDLAVADRTP